MGPAANPDAELTARELATALGVSPQLVNRWHTYGWLDADRNRVYLAEVGRNRKGERLFRYIDGVRAEAATRRSPKSYRKPRGGWSDLNRKTDAGPSPINAAA
jgi:phytoene/squalene synthetase